MTSAKFNDIDLFKAADGALTVDVNGTNIEITQQGFSGEINTVVGDNIEADSSYPRS